MLAALLALVAAAATPATAAPLSAQDAAWLNRLTWGANAADVAAFKQLGREGWIRDQLQSPPDRVRMPEAARALLDEWDDGPGDPFETAVRLEVQRRDAMARRRVDGPAAGAQMIAYGQALKTAYGRATHRSIVRDLYSQDQLREQLTWFWFNHFNIRFNAVPYSPLATHYLERTIRPHALGRFCDLVRATQRHPAMLLYLNNAQNQVGKINENYARELLELHTMGVGSGYTQQDIQQLARVLSGLMVDLVHWPPPPAPRGGMREGLTLFDPAFHDGGNRQVLGVRITGKGMAGIDEATTLVCRHPATARRISQRLAQYMMGDAVPAAVVEALAAEFTRTDGDITAMLTLLFARPEFAASLGRAYKDPNHYLLSAIRLAWPDRLIGNPGLLVAELHVMGQGRLSRVTPDGWPLEADRWNASGQLENRFRLADQIGGGIPRLFLPNGLGGREELRAARQVPQLAAMLAQTGLYGRLAPATQGALATAAPGAEWNSLFLSSPEFMRR
jgi:uncharacterized protein (DUF1800 family)